MKNNLSFSFEIGDEFRLSSTFELFTPVYLSLCNRCFQFTLSLMLNCIYDILLELIVRSSSLFRVGLRHLVVESYNDLIVEFYQHPEQILCIGAFSCQSSQ